MSNPDVVVAGGGAAGFFAAVTCAELCPAAKVMILEKSPTFLSKVRISGGGRCNVTHACFDPRELSLHYPRGGQALLGPLQRFGPSDTVAWFERRGVKLKTEPDGRMFPITDSSQIIVDCLFTDARRANVELHANCAVEKAVRLDDGGFELVLGNRDSLRCSRLMLATGGCRVPAAGALVVSLGHTLELPVPSLFTFHLEELWLKALAGITVAQTEVSIPGETFRETGPLLVTHAGVSGPVILRLSAWGARELHRKNYRFPLLVNWLPKMPVEAITQELQSRRRTQPARLVVNSPLAPLPARLWEQLALRSGVSRETRWAALSRPASHRLQQQLSRTELQVSGKTLNQDEFVTCGGVRLAEVHFKTMESRICPGLFFGGEILNIDGLTGGFNFQAAWTTGWIAGTAMAQILEN